MLHTLIFAVLLFCLRLVVGFFLGLKTEQTQEIFLDNRNSSNHILIGNQLKNISVEHQFMERVQDTYVTNESKGTLTIRAATTLSLDPDSVVDQLNTVRGGLGGGNVRCVTWSTDLVAFAARWAQSCTTNRNAVSVRLDLKADSSCYPTIGYTFFVGLASANQNQPTAKQIVQSMTGSARFTAGNNQCTALSDGGCDNFRQAAWANSAEIGCALVRCDQIEGADEEGYTAACAFGLRQDDTVSPITPGAPCSCCPPWKNQCLTKHGLCCGPNTPCAGGDTDNRIVCEPQRRELQVLVPVTYHPLPILYTPPHPPVQHQVFSRDGPEKCVDEDDSFCVYWKSSGYCEVGEMTEDSQKMCPITCRVPCLSQSSKGFVALESPHKKNNIASVVPQARAAFIPSASSVNVVKKVGTNIEDASPQQELKEHKNRYVQKKKADLLRSSGNPVSRKTSAIKSQAASFQSLFTVRHVKSKTSKQRKLYYGF